MAEGMIIREKLMEIGMEITLLLLGATPNLRQNRIKGFPTLNLNLASVS
jgi:hypothetical protein